VLSGGAKEHGKIESALHTRLCMEHHTPSSQEGIPAEAWQGSIELALMEEKSPFYTVL
jgi:hypothetical protein